MSPLSICPTSSLPFSDTSKNCSPSLSKPFQAYSWQKLSSQPCLNCEVNSLSKDALSVLIPALPLCHEVAAQSSEVPMEAPAMAVLLVLDHPLSHSCYYLWKVAALSSFSFPLLEIYIAYTTQSNSLMFRQLHRYLIYPGNL